MTIYKCEVYENNNNNPIYTTGNKTDEDTAINDAKFKINSLNTGETYTIKLFQGQEGYSLWTEISSEKYPDFSSATPELNTSTTSVTPESSSTTVDPTNSDTPPPQVGGGDNTPTKSSQTWTLSDASVTYDSTIDMDNYISGSTQGGKTWSVTNGTGSATIGQTSGVLNPSTVGKVTVTLYASGNNSYKECTKTCTVTINRASATQNWTLASTKSITYSNNGTFNLNELITTANGSPIGNQTWTITSGGSCASVSGNTLTIKGVGTVVVKFEASGGASGNYNYSTKNASCTITINRASATQNWTLASTKSITYSNNGTFDLNTLITSGTPVGTKTWTITSGASYASVSGNTLTIKSVGTVVVKFEASGGISGNYNYSSSTKTCTVTITAASAPQTWTLSAKSVTYGSTIDMNTAISGTVYGTKTWSVSNGTGSATINATTGLLTPSKVGTVTVQLIASGGVSGNYNYSSSTKTCTVTINNKLTQNLKIYYGGNDVTNKVIYVLKGEDFSLVYEGNQTTVTYSILENGTNTNVVSDTLTSSLNTPLAYGFMFHALSCGSQNIKFACPENNDYSDANATVTVNVYEKQNQSVSINKKSDNTDASNSKITVNNSLTLVSTGNTTVKSWSITEGTSYASITSTSNEAIITGNARGRVKVKVIYNSTDDYNEGSKEITLYVYANQDPNISISNNSIVYTSNSDDTKTKKLTISVTNYNTTPSYEVSGNIKLNNNEITATGSASGTASITITCPEDNSNYWNEWKGTRSITIKHEKTPAVVVQDTSTTNTTSTTKMAQSFTLTAKTITYGDSNTKMSINGNYFGTLTWHSSDTSVAEVYNEGNDIGIIRYKKVGSTNISLTAEGDNAHQSYTCEEVKLEIIKQTGTSFHIEGKDTVTAGSTLQLTHNDTTDRKITWSSSNEFIADVNSDTGLVTGKTSGEVTIKATANESSTMKSSTAKKTIEVKAESSSTPVPPTDSSTTSSTTSNTPPPVNKITPEFNIEDVTISVLNSKLSSTKDFISDLKYDNGKKAVTFEIKPKFKDSNEDKFNFTYSMNNNAIVNYNNTGLFGIIDNGTTAVTIKGIVKTEYSNSYTSEVSCTFNITIKDTYSINTVFYIDFVPNLDKYVTCTESSIGRLKRYTFNIPPSYITNINNPILGNITLDDGIQNNPYDTYAEYYKSIEITCNTDYIKIAKNNDEIQLTAIKYYGDKFLSIKLTHPEVQRGCYKYSKASSEIQIQTLTYNLIQYLNLRNNNIFEFDADENGLIAKNDCQYFFDVFNYYPAIEQISTVDYEIIFHTHEDKNLIVELKKILTNNGSTIIYIYYDKTLFGFIHNNNGYPSYEPYNLEKEYSDNLYGDVKNNVLFNGIIILLNCDINVYDYTESGYIKNAEQHYNKKISLNNITNLHPGYTNIYQIKVKELIKQIGNLKLNNNTNKDYLNYYIRLNSKSLKLQYYDYHKNGCLFDCNSVISIEENSMICLTNLLYTYNDGKYIPNSTNGDNNDNATLEILIPKDYNNSEINVEIEIGFDLCITDAYNENSNMNNYAFNIQYKNNKNIIKRLSINSVNKEIIEYTYNNSNYTALHFRLPKSQLTNIISNYNDIYKLLSINYRNYDSYNSISNDTTIIEYLNSYNAAKLNELYTFSKITKTIHVYGYYESSSIRYAVLDLSSDLINYDSSVLILTADAAYDKCKWIFYKKEKNSTYTASPVPTYSINTTGIWSENIIEIIDYDVNKNGKCDKIKLRIKKHSDLLKLKEIYVKCVIDENVNYYESSDGISLKFDNMEQTTTSSTSTPSPSSTPVPSSTPSPMSTTPG